MAGRRNENCVAQIDANPYEDMYAYENTECRYDNVKRITIPARGPEIAKPLPSRDLKQRVADGKQENNKWKWLAIGLVVSTVIYTAIIAALIGILIKSNQALILQGQSLEQANRRSDRTALLCDKIPSKLGWYGASNGMFFKRFSSKDTHDNAKARCKTFGARLLTSGLRNSSVFRELLDNVLSPPYGWISYNNRDKDGEWRWIDGVKNNSVVVQWNTGQPIKRDGILCSYIKNVINGTAMINGVKCDHKPSKAFFTCEL